MFHMKSSGVATWRQGAKCGSFPLIVATGSLIICIHLFGVSSSSCIFLQLFVGSHLFLDTFTSARHVPASFILSAAMCQGLQRGGYAKPFQGERWKAQRTSQGPEA